MLAFGKSGLAFAWRAESGNTGRASWFESVDIRCTEIEQNVVSERSGLAAGEFFPAANSR